MNSCRLLIVGTFVAVQAAVGFVPAVRAESPAFEWVSLLAFEDPPHPAIDTQVDREGNVIVAYYNWDNGATSLTTSRTWSDHVVLKLDPAGNLLWQLAVLPNIRKLAVDAAGNTYVAGSLLRGHPSNPVMPASYFGARGITTTGNGTAYVARISPGGDLEWVRLDGGAAVADANALAIASDGGYFVAGIYTKTAASFGSTALPSPVTTQARNVFLAKYAANGAVEWVRVGETAGTQTGQGQIALGPGDSLFLAWNVFDATLAFGPGGEALGGSQLVRFTSAGERLWVRSLDGYTDRLAVDSGGNALIAGNPLALSISKFDSGGTLLWEHSPEVASDSVRCWGLVVDARGNAYAAGSFGDRFVGGTRLPGTVSFGADTVSTIARFDVFVAKYDASGKPLWLTQTAGLDPNAGYPARYSDTRVNALALDPRGGGVAILGATRGTVEFGDITLEGPDGLAGGQGVFVARLNEPVPATVELKVTRVGSRLALSWPAAASAFVLESAATLATSVWSSVPGTPVVEGDREVLIVESTGAAEFYRLRRL